MQAGDLGQQGFLAVLVLGEAPGLVVEGPLEEGLDLEGIILLEKGEHLPFALLVADHEGDGLVVGEYCFYFGVGLEEGDVLVDRIEYLHEVFIEALLIFLIAFLEGYHD